ncbi:hypothetical protein TNCV_2743331 [Trichonephila clavipes]|nr:hypothetical protein TNCV_2743331 [Trichonephila clavipes]
MLDHLEDNIRRVIADIRPQMLEKVIENWMSRLDYIRASCGSPMPEIIFKIRKISQNTCEDKVVVTGSHCAFLLIIILCKFFFNFGLSLKSPSIEITLSYANVNAIKTLEMGDLELVVSR